MLVLMPGGSAGSMSPISLPPGVVPDIIIRLTLEYTDNNAADPTEVHTATVDSVVNPMHWNTVPCTYSDDCMVFETSDIIMFAPPTEGGLAVLSWTTVDEFDEDSDVNILSSKCDLRCTASSECSPFQSSPGELLFDGVGKPLGTVHLQSFNSGFCPWNFFGRELGNRRRL